VARPLRHVQGVLQPRSFQRPPHMSVVLLLCAAYDADQSPPLREAASIRTARLMLPSYQVANQNLIPTSSTGVSRKCIQASPPTAADGVQDDDNPTLLLLMLRGVSPAAHRLHERACLCNRTAPAEGACQSLSVPQNLRCGQQVIEQYSNVQHVTLVATITSTRPSCTASAASSCRPCAVGSTTRGVSLVPPAVPRSHPLHRPGYARRLQ
jgi:hypothetical protein